MPFVVNRYIIALHRCPECLKMTIEEEGVEAAYRCDLLAEVQYVDGFAGVLCW